MSPCDTKSETGDKPIVDASFRALSAANAAVESCGAQEGAIAGAYTLAGSVPDTTVPRRLSMKATKGSGKTASCLAEALRVWLPAVPSYGAYAVEVYVECK